MVTIEVNLKEGEETPEQHLDEGEHIERVIVPLNELYHKLQGMSSPHSPSLALFCLRRIHKYQPPSAMSKEEGKIVDAR